MNVTKNRMKSLKKRWIGVSIAVLGLGGAGLMSQIHPAHANVVNTTASPGGQNAVTQTQAPTSSAPVQQQAPNINSCNHHYSIKIPVPSV